MQTDPAIHAQGNLPSRTLGWCWMLFFIPLAHAGVPTIISNLPPVLHTEVNTTLTLTCTAQNLSIAWYHENVPLATGGSDNTPRHRIIGNGLEIPNLGLQQAGWYTCATSNQFGRAERDFLVVVGAPPRITLQQQGGLITVETMTRVEIPCVAVGTPYPESRWFDGVHEIIDGSSNGRYRIDPTTNSLVIYNFTSADVSQQGFFCNVSNSFGIALSSPVMVVVMNEGGPNLQSPFNDIPLFAVTTNVVESLGCTGLGPMDILDLNLQFNWTRNFNQFLSASNSIILNGSNPETSGYHCCEVTRLRRNGSILARLNTYCITVVVRYEPEFDTVSNNTSIQAGHSVNLHCKANTLNRFYPPNFSWTDRNSVSLPPGTNGSVTVSQNSQAMSYLRVTEARVEDTGNYTCSAANFVARVNRTVAVRVVDNTCSDNVLRNHNAEVEEDPLSSWSLSSTGANFTTVNNERVFVVSYNSSSAEYPRLVQTIAVPSNATSAYVSGRMRHTNMPMAPSSSLGVAVINVSLDGGLLGVLEQPFPSLISWQWVAGWYNVTRGRNISVVLTVRRGESEDHIQGTTYFDDLCVSFSTESLTTPEPSPLPTGPSSELTSTVLIAIAAGGGVGLLLVIFVLLLLCICCCRKSSKGAAKPMRKMSTIIKKKFSKSHYKPGMETHTPGAYKPKPEVAGDHPIYEVPLSDQLPENSEGNYVQPYISVGKPIYTPLDPDLLESEHHYSSATPQMSSSNLAVGTMETGEYLNVSHESQSPLLASGGSALQGREYLKVEHGSQANEYLELLASSASQPQKQSSIDSVTGEIYSYVNEGLM